MENSSPIIPIYTSRGEPQAFLSDAYIFNPQGEWIGWLTPEGEVFSVLGYYIGYLTRDPRILRKRFLEESKPHRTPPPPPSKTNPPVNFPLASLMSEIRYDTIDVLMEEPERLHTIDMGDLREDLD